MDAKRHEEGATPALDAPLGIEAGKPRTWSIQRFSSCGAQRFLASPVPRRRRRTESMFPVPRERIERLLAVSGLEACGDDAPYAASDVNEGKRLFSTHCAGCHGALVEAPLLRLGFPLLARTYFGGRVRSGSAGTLAPAWGLAWRTNGARAVRGRDATTADTTMPAFANLSDAEVDKLYAYVSVDSSDLAPLPRPFAPPPHDVWPAALGLAVFAPCSATFSTDHAVTATMPVRCRRWRSSESSGAHRRAAPRASSSSVFASANASGAAPRSRACSRECR